tara:strand:+ start:1152 stop:2027 length:876 start_codon:yes stop_codon:yes gene_type:complete
MTNTIPEKWCVKLDENNYNQLYKYYVSPTGYHHSTKINTNNWNIDIQKGYTEITFEQFKEHVMKIKEEFPKDDFGVIVESMNGKEIIKYLISKGFTNEYNYAGYNLNGEGYCIPNYSKTIHCFSVSHSIRNIYTLEQLKQLDNNNMKEKEILGYKAPYDMYEGKLKKGVLVKEFPQPHMNKAYGIPGENGFFDQNILIPKEIAQTWEPVYKSSEVIITINNVVINIKGDKMCAEGRKCDIKWLRAIRELFNKRTSLGVWDSKVESITIGCKTGWKVEHLDEIIKKYEEINE